jgi:hypothetical protein
MRETSQRYWDSSWRWSISEHRVSADPPDFEITYHDSIVACDGTQRLSWVPEHQKGMLTQPNDAPVGGTQLLRALGRSLDMDNLTFTAPMSSLLQHAKSTTFLSPTESEPWPGIHAEQVLEKFDVDVEVRLDPQHGFAPRVVRVIRPGDALIADEVLVLSYQACDGVFVPRLTVQCGRYAQVVKDVASPISDQVLTDLAAALRLEGLPDELHTEEVRDAIAFTQRVLVLDEESRRVSGPMLVFDEGRELICPQIVVIEGVELNRRSRLRTAFDGVDPNGRIFDGFKREWTTMSKASAQLSESPLNPLLLPGSSNALGGSQ